MDNNEINSIILKIYNEQKKTNNKIDNIGKAINGKMEEMQGQIGEMQAQIEGIEGRIEGLENKYAGLQEEVIKLQKEVKEMKGTLKEIPEIKNELRTLKEIPEIKNELRTLSRRVAVIEKEHGEKLQILLDVVTGNSKKSHELEKRIEKGEKIINKHSDEIYYLKEKVQEA